MIYEIEIAWRTLQREGAGSLFTKIGIYFRQIAFGVSFFLRQLPQNKQPEQLVDFVLNDAKACLQMCQVRSEINQLADLVAKLQPKTVVEIGTAHGGTLFLWCRLAHPEATIVSIDLPGGIHGGGYPYWKSFIYRKFPVAAQKLHLLRGDSHQPEMLAQLKNKLSANGKIDFLFIDGDHTYAGVKSDFEMYAGLVRPGGLIVFHDICLHPASMHCHVDRFWQEIKNSYRTREFIQDLKQGSCGIGVIEV